MFSLLGLFFTNWKILSAASTTLAADGLRDVWPIVDETQLCICLIKLIRTCPSDLVMARKTSNDKTLVVPSHIDKTWQERVKISGAENSGIGNITSLLLQTSLMSLGIFCTSDNIILIFHISNQDRYDFLHHMVDCYLDYGIKKIGQILLLG